MKDKDGTKAKIFVSIPIVVLLLNFTPAFFFLIWISWIPGLICGLCGRHYVKKSRDNNLEKYRGIYILANLEVGISIFILLWILMLIFGGVGA